MAKHLAIFDRETTDAIFSGRKKIEGRFSQIKIPPFGKVSSGDTIYMKVSGEKVIGEFTVDRVFYYDHPRKEELDLLVKKYGREMALPENFWLEHEKVSFATLMFIKVVNKFIIPPEFVKKDLRGWVVLE